MFYGYGEQIWSGTWLTIELTVLTVLFSTIIGVFAALCKLSRNPLISFPATTYSTLIRSVPDLVLLLLIFYNLQEIVNWICELFGNEQGYQLDALISGVITLSFIYGAFMTETFRSAFLSIPKGQIEAGFACGMSKWQVFRYITFPQMLRHALPGVSNNFQVILKATAVVSLIGLEDIVRISQYASGSTQKFMYFAVMAGVIYLMISVIAGIILNLLNKRFSVGTQRSST
ncbi:hypothetical protein IX83_04925 [Basilea psittacipulmonis DSM 24701]|uniref:ABC transmembrane type-1 domain-containing protein n=1 Tax=Basilea psittacipulmonis DSM 24701 TaxID=1072685 RepID=A0A077DD31_9BURK|nr:hypothetical protein IX83_04925 [Basilea psittacipulmonis DSM 24701]